MSMSRSDESAAALRASLEHWRSALDEIGEEYDLARAVGDDRHIARVANRHQQVLDRIRLLQEQVAGLDR